MHTLIEQDTIREHAPRDPGPGLNLSALRQFDRALPVQGFGIKYVVEGLERYTVDGIHHPVRSGHYLLANRCSQTHVLIDSPHPVKGLCIELTTELLDEVVHAHQCPEAFSDMATSSFFSGPEFLESVYSAEHSKLGALLRRTATDLFADRFDERYAGPDLFHALAEQVVLDHRAIVPQLRAIGAVRSGTRKDIYRRVLRAKAFLEGDLQAPLSVEVVARDAAMSAYHFSRAFRQVEGMSPYQYRLLCRLQAAREMLVKGHSAIGDMALAHGFADAPSFNKAFRKRFGLTPSAVMLGSSRK
jgi:AraC-like DNA-binding protein